GLVAMAGDLSRQRRRRELASGLQGVFRPSGGAVADSITITDNRSGESVEIPITDGGVSADPWRKFLPGIWFSDPAFMTTAVASSAVPYLDGDNGVLRYRGYPIEQLAEHSSYLEVAYLLVYGELPTKEQC